MTFYDGQDSSVINATVVSTAKFDTSSFIKVDDHKPTGVEESEAKTSPVAYQFKLRFPPPEERFGGRYTFAIPTIDIYHTFQLNILKHDTESTTTPPKTMNPQEDVKPSPSISNAINTLLMHNIILYYYRKRWICQSESKR